MGIHTTCTDHGRQVLTVSQLTHRIKALLEENFPFIWITGEISNLRIPSSGHYYFMLKDEKSQINALMFRGQNRNLKFMPEDGMAISGLGRVAVYEPRGSYQIILEYMEPAGVGALQVAFEQLKARLADEGLFDEANKKPLPFLPRKISVITSPTGAVIHDILNVTLRRYPTIHVEIIPVSVQGSGAEFEIAAGIQLLNSRGDADVAILARGGGSIEDLAPFNSEVVARAIFASTVPIVSAVGHETDFTIADFVADLRAPTPSAAAELAVPLRDDLISRVTQATRSLKICVYEEISRRRRELKNFTDRLVDPKRKLQDLRIKHDDLTNRLYRVARNVVHRHRERLQWRIERLNGANPLTLIALRREKNRQIQSCLHQQIQRYFSDRQHRLRELTSRLHDLNPEAILSRGYSITRTIPDKTIVYSASSVDKGQNLEILLSKGKLIATVKDAEG